MAAVLIVGAVNVTVLLAIVALAFGAFDEANFWQVFAVFFPAVTGIAPRLGGQQRHHEGADEDRCAQRPGGRDRVETEPTHEMFDRTTSTASA